MNNINLYSSFTNYSLYNNIDDVVGGALSVNVNSDSGFYAAQTKLSSDDAASMINGLLVVLVVVFLIVFLFKR